jgi:hypothetical protein
MPPGGSGDRRLDLLVEHFSGLVIGGRGDLARGRHLYSLRALDALWDPDGVLRLPYRPSRNPGAFLVMTFDLVGDACYGYSLLLDGGGGASELLATRVSAHVRARMQAPWSRLVAELDRLGLPHLGAMLAGFVPAMLRRSPASGLPAELARLRSWMTPAQTEAFDPEAHMAGLSFATVLRLLGWEGGSSVRSGREQHPTGGDLRAHLRRKLDRPWAAALRLTRHPTWLDVLAGMPVPAEDLAAQRGEHDFAVAYSLATDAPAPGRRWDAPEPFVTEAGREEFAFLTGRGVEEEAVRRATRLERWGASLVFPEAYALVDARLVATPELEPLHAGGRWRAAAVEAEDALAALRREFIQRVAEEVAKVADRRPTDRGAAGEEAVA